MLRRIQVVAWCVILGLFVGCKNNLPIPWVSKRPAASAVQPYEFSTSPFIHTQSIRECMTYSGNSCIQPQQWGFIDIDPIAKQYQMWSGIGKQGAPAQSPKTYIIGDCWQSGSGVAASANARKWVLTTGTPEMCADSGCSSYFNEVPPGSNHWVCGGQPRPAQAVQIWKFESGIWKWKGQVGADLYLYGRFAKLRVVGDIAYVLESHAGIPTPPPLWSKIDLNTLAIIQTGIPEANVPPGEAQQGIDGTLYTLTKIGNPATYRLAAIGPAPPTITPGGPTLTATKTATKTSTGVATKTPTALSGCCIEGVNCPPGAPIPRCTPTPCWNCKTNTPLTKSPISTSRTPTPSSSCLATATSLCLGTGNRFRVEAVWARNDGSTGHATAIPRTIDTGEFWFFSASNIEMVVKVLDGCSIGGKYWVFSGGLTNVKVDLTVTDTKTGVVKTYHNPQGVAFQPIQDTAAFSCQ